MRSDRKSLLALVRVGSLTVLCAVAALLCACSKQPDNTPRSSGGDASAVANPSSNPDPKIVSTPLIDDLSPKLCKVLTELAPQAPQLSAIGTQAQLVMSIAAAFDSRADALQRVSAEIDAVATASCPTARDALLKVLKMQSLQDAVR